MTRRVRQETIPVDVRWHVLSLTGPILHVATRSESCLEVWHLEDTDVAPIHHAYRVIGTGQPLAPALAFHVATVITPSGRLVWHLFEHG